MAVNFHAFAGDTTGAAPANFTARWTATGETWAVREKTGTLGGKCLEHTRTTTARRAYSWDVPGSAADAEILVRWRSTSSATDQIWLTLRGSGGAGSEGGYVFRNTSRTSIRLERYVGGTATLLGTALTVPSIPTDTWHWIRFRVEGTAIKVKIWAGDKMPEPAAWTIERTDATIAGAGRIAIGNAAATGTRDYDALAVGTNGDSAAFPPSDEQRTTQSVLLVLDTGEPDLRTTQSVLLVLGEETNTVPSRITQSVVLAVAAFATELRNTQSALLALADHVSCLTRWCQCWTITRKDGQVFGFTSLDRPIVWRGVTHTPCNSLTATASEMSTSQGQVGSMELAGIISDVGISERDLYRGLFDGAQIEIWNVPWENAGREIPFRLLAGTTGTAKHAENGFQLEIITDSARLKQRALLEYYTAACRYNFGSANDARCPVDLAAITVSGSVTGTAVPNASTQATRRIFTDSTRSEAQNEFRYGVLTWTTGDNAGASAEVKDFNGGAFVLWEPMLYEIKAGDEYTVYPGCDKSPGGHKKFNADMTDYGGFPHVPGLDSIAQSPDAKE